MSVAKTRALARDKVAKSLARRRPWSVPRELIEEKLVEHRGNVSQVATDLDVNYAMLADVIDRDEGLLLLCSRLRDKIVDSAEQVVRDRLKAGDAKVAQFVLQTLGKDRGYAKPSTVDHVHSGEVVHRRGPDLSHLSSDELRTLDGLLDKAEGEVIEGEA